MNTAHWHLMLNHIPIVGTVIGIGLLVAGYLFKNNNTVKQTALGVFIFSALFAIPAYLTGEGAEDVLEKHVTVSESLIENHEDKGSVFLVLISIIGVISIGTLILERMKNTKVTYLYFVILMVSVAAIILAKSLATSGGEIRHTEIRSGAQVNMNEGALPTDSANNNEKGEKDDD